MKPVPILILMASFLFSCVKIHQKPKEDFRFVGTIVDCDGNPIKNAKVIVEARHLTWVVDNVDEVGTANTDASGYYEITPEKTEVFNSPNTVRNVYRIRANYGSYTEQKETIWNDSIRQAGLDFYTIDIMLCN